MSEREFELYLSLLTRLLRLKAGQREEIADELRDHLEQRLEELTRAGCPRDEAIRRALDEFGDAAGLAAHFTHVATRRTRRLIMRLTFGTAAVAAMTVFLALAFWPQPPGGPAPRVAVAQAPAADAAAGPGVPGGSPAERPHTEGETAVERKLQQPLAGAEFVEMPLGEVLQFLGDEAAVDVVIDRRLTEERLDLKQPITLVLEHATPSIGAVMDLVLDQARAEVPVGYTVRDGFVYVTDAPRTYETRVYNVRDLTAGREPPSANRSRPGTPMGEAYGYPGVRGPAAGHGGPAGGHAVGMPKGHGSGAAMMPGMPGGMMPPGMSSPMGGGYGSGETTLAGVVMSTVQPETWVFDGTTAGPSVEQYDGLLIVKHNSSAHREIRELLEMMRAAIREQNPPPPATPGLPGFPGANATLPR